MKKVFTFVVVALFAMTVNAQENRVFKYCVPADFDLTDFHKVIEAKDENGELMGTIEMLSSPTKDKLFPFIKDENGEPILDSEGKPQFDEEHPNPAWSYKVNNPEGNMSLTGREEGFGYCIIGQGNPVMSQEEGWAYNEDKGAWYWKVGNYVFWLKCGTLNSCPITLDSQGGGLVGGIDNLDDHIGTVLRHGGAYADIAGFTAECKAVF